MGHRIYVPGGLTATASRLPTLQCYDMVAGRWVSDCAPMAVARDRHGVAALQGELWVVGGWSRVVGGGAASLTASVEVYNPRLNTWHLGVPLPHACADAGCVVVQC